MKEFSIHARHFTAGTAASPPRYESIYSQTSFCFQLNNHKNFQYCEYWPEYEKCKKWLEKNLPTEFEKLNVGCEKKASGEGAGAGEEEEKKRQKRGGKGVIRANKKKEENNGKEKKITVSRAPRGKKKSVTVVVGLNTFGGSLNAGSRNIQLQS